MADLPDIERGTTYPISGSYTDANGDTDITGATIFFTVKTTEYDADTTDSDALVKKTITSFTDPTAGLYDFELTPTDTATIAPDRYYYDLKIKLASGKIFLLAEGRVRIGGSPTNRES